jgi:hypothetical protein
LGHRATGIILYHNIPLIAVTRLAGMRGRVRRWFGTRRRRCCCRGRRTSAASRHANAVCLA